MCNARYLKNRPPTGLWGPTRLFDHACDPDGLTQVSPGGPITPQRTHLAKIDSDGDEDENPDGDGRDRRRDGERDTNQKQSRRARAHARTVTELQQRVREANRLQIDAENRADEASRRQTEAEAALVDHDHQLTAARDLAHTYFLQLRDHKESKTRLENQYVLVEAQVTELQKALANRDGDLARRERALVEADARLALARQRAEAQERALGTSTTYQEATWMLHDVSELEISKGLLQLKRDPQRSAARTIAAMRKRTALLEEEVAVRDGAWRMVVAGLHREMAKKGEAVWRQYTTGNGKRKGKGPGRLGKEVKGTRLGPGPADTRTIGTNPGSESRPHESRRGGVSAPGPSKAAGSVRGGGRLPWRRGRWTEETIDDGAMPEAKRMKVKGTASGSGPSAGPRSGPSTAFVPRPSVAAMLQARSSAPPLPPRNSTVVIMVDDDDAASELTRDEEPHKAGITSTANATTAATATATTTTNANANTNTNTSAVVSDAFRVGVPCTPHIRDDGVDALDIDTDSLISSSDDDDEEEHDDNHHQKQQQRQQQQEEEEEKEEYIHPQELEPERMACGTSSASTIHPPAPDLRARHCGVVDPEIARIQAMATDLDQAMDTLIPTSSPEDHEDPEGPELEMDLLTRVRAAWGGRSFAEVIRARHSDPHEETTEDEVLPEADTKNEILQEADEDRQEAEPDRTGVLRPHGEALPTRRETRQHQPNIAPSPPRARSSPDMWANPGVDFSQDGAGTFGGVMFMTQNGSVRLGVANIDMEIDFDMDIYTEKDGRRDGGAGEDNQEEHGGVRAGAGVGDDMDGSYEIAGGDWWTTPTRPVEAEVKGEEDHADNARNPRDAGRMNRVEMCGNHASVRRPLTTLTVNTHTRTGG